MYSCKVCGRDFTSRDGLYHHKKVVHHGVRYTCKICDKVFTRMYSLKCHIRTHTGEQYFKCDICHKRFVYKTILNYHLRSHLGEAAKCYKCQICGKSYNTSGVLKQHILIHNERNPYVCVKCGMQFKKEAYMKRHSTIHANARTQFKCQQCGQKYTTKGNLKRHMGTHQSLSMHCKNCELTFSNKEALNRHTRKYHPPGGIYIGRYSCVFCGKRYRHRCELDVHILKHIHEKPLFCELCAAEFVIGTYKYDHIRQHHTGERSHMCEICRKRFSSAGGLKNHMLSHTTQVKKMVTCQLCGKQVTQRCLYLHLKTIHPTSLEDVRYGCAFCGKKYHVRNDIYHHLLVHIRERPYHCEYCEHKFTYPSSKKKHIQRYHISEML